MGSPEIRARKERLKKLRKWKELTADEMAEALEIERSTYYRYESPVNDSFLSRIQVEQVIQKTGARKEWLLNGEEPVFKDEQITAPTQVKSGYKQTFTLSIDPNAAEIVIILRRG